MKRCPQCRRDYYDATLLYCLDDGSALLDGPASGTSEPRASAGDQFHEPQTAILHTSDAVGEAPTRAQIHTTGQTAALPSEAAARSKRGFDKRLIMAGIAAALIALVAYVGYRYFKAAPSGQINSIAVLPFQNRSGNADSEYLSDGLSDSLIYRLTQLPNLKVSPTSSVIRYKGRQTDVAEIAKDLDVDAVMTGKLAQRGDDLTTDRFTHRKVDLGRTI